MWITMKHWLSLKFETLLISCVENSKVPLSDGKILLPRLDIDSVLNMSFILQSIGCADSTCILSDVLLIYLKISF